MLRRNPLVVPTDSQETPLIPVIPTRANFESIFTCQIPSGVSFSPEETVERKKFTERIKSFADTYLSGNSHFENNWIYFREFMTQIRESAKGIEL